MSVKLKRKKIAYVTGTRADFGLMTPVLQAIDKSRKLNLQLYATGMHLMPEFGNTINQVKKMFSGVKSLSAKFKNSKPKSQAEFSANLLSLLVKEFSKNRPDFVLTLGDRPEMLCVAIACLYLRIPTGQIHGGEKTSTIDEVARHAITKISNIHFPATKKSADRIKKMGEDSWRINITGAPALDYILSQPLPNRRELFKYLKIGSQNKVILVTNHPISEDNKESERQMEEILIAVSSFDLPVVVIYPCADPGHQGIIKAINRYRNKSNFRIFKNLDYRQFLALERESAVWVGNSSAAMIESASFKTPIVNVGSRQLGRQRGNNVIDVDYNKAAIHQAIKKSLFDKSYLNKLRSVTNPYGDGKTSQKIVKVLEDMEINSKLLTKQITY